MADNVAITAGSGTSIATDDVSSVHYQFVKLADGTLDSSTKIAAGGGVQANALRVTLATDSTGIVASTNTGNIAHDSVDSGNPVKIGMRAVAHGSNPTGVAAADRTDWYANRAGVPFVIGGHPNVITARLNFTTAQTDVSLVGTINSGTKVVCTGFQVTLDNASTVFPSVRIGFGATNTPTTTGVIGSHPGVPAGGGFGRGDGSGILGIGADGEELRITSVGTATGGGVDVVISYYTIES